MDNFDSYLARRQLEERLFQLIVGTLKLYLATCFPYNYR